MSKKVGIVSCYFKHNYGSMLQAFATKKILDYNNIPNETIDISNLVDFSKGRKKYYFSQITNFKFIKSKFGMIKFKLDKMINKDLKRNIRIRDKKYNSFIKEYNLSRKCKTYKDLGELSKEKYSDVIVGSDQLWLPVNVVADYYTLNWVPNNINKISYATSFGFSNIDSKYNELYKSFLKRINHLSVREESGVKIVNKLGLDAKLVCDPTLLLTRNEWEELIDDNRIINEEYILCYFLGNNIDHRKFAEKLKKETGLKIVSLNHSDEYVKYSEVFADYKPYDIGPMDFVNLIKHSKFVLTDSFHATVFSIIFNKEFYDFRRFKDNNIISTNSRLDSLLNKLNIPKSRIISGKESLKDIVKDKIDYQIVNEKVEIFRNESKKWLLDSLSQSKGDEKHIDITSKEDCCGCTACKSICPNNAIKMVRDEEGFLYPTIDATKCINCGLCKKVCPILKKQTSNDFKQVGYIFQNKDENTRKESTSGGFYTAIGEYIIKKGGYVYGASYDENFVVKHTCAKDILELKKFRKSKYVQSNQNEVFKEIKERLDSNHLICYSGTPCQVAGLKSYLNKDYNNLVLIDIMCHSVPSPLVFEKYKEYILKKMNAKKILDIDFRDKSKYGYKYSMMTVLTDNGKYSQGIDTDPYLRAFFSDYSVRPSCYNCKFKTQKRVSDITIWDCFNISEIEKNFDDDKGTTRLLIQSQKGLDIIKSLSQNNIKEIDVNILTSNVKEMLQSVNYNSGRTAFFKDINKKSLFDDYFPKNIKTRLNSCIRKFLSITGTYTFIKKTVKRLLRK